MHKVICSIFDLKAQAWLTPMFFLSIAQAARSFEDVLKDANSEFYKHPEDYVLYKLGTWDERNGILDAPQDFVEITRGMNADLEVINGAK